MGLMEKTLSLKKQFSGRNLQMLKALLAYIEDDYIQEEDEIEILMNIGTYNRLLDLGLYKEVKRGSRERRFGDR
ncbi:MAG: hypothetical protein JW874_10715 [Spirochaetales bacterium]|nr:hypothetical protein [Spirochaetales bacterium]